MYSGFFMYEAICSVGERGQITIPKEIRKKEKLNKKDKLYVKLDNGEILLKRIVSKKETESLLKEYYQKHSVRNLKVNSEFKKIDAKESKWLDENFPW
jgi:AbrB family looped-hinge helix DNA binding protein